MAWFRLAADQGNAEAQMNIGKMYANGLGVGQDQTQAVNWVRKAADQGYASAQVLMGLYFDQGDGIAQDYAQATSWYQKAADQGDATAEYELGQMYSMGHGTARDYAQAMIWYHKAADQNFDSAQFSIGVLFQYGLGVRQDYAQALIWYRKAADQGNAAAKAKVAALERQMGSAVGPSAQTRLAQLGEPRAQDDIIHLWCEAALTGGGSTRMLLSIDIAGKYIKEDFPSEMMTLEYRDGFFGKAVTRGFLAKDAEKIRQVVTIDDRYITFGGEGDASPARIDRRSAIMTDSNGQAHQCNLVPKQQF